MIAVRPDCFMPGQAPQRTVIDRQTAVRIMEDDLISVEASPSKRRQLAQDICFARWLVLRGVVNDKDGAA